MLLTGTMYRVAFTAFCAAWLSVQFLVIGISPAWGSVLPHSHITNGAMTEADWEEHEREHRLGINSEILYKTYCDRSGIQNKAVTVTSVPDAQANLSVFNLFNAAPNAARIAIPAFDANSARLAVPAFVCAEIFFPPPHPPPNN